MLDAIAKLGGTLSPTQQHRTRRIRRVARLEAYLLRRRQELDAAGEGGVEAVLRCWCAAVDAMAQEGAEAATLTG